VKRATISDIASAAGVSTAAVSYALNGKAGISEKTRSHILKVAARYDWQPNTNARSLATTSTDAYGLIWTSPLEALRYESFPMQFISGLESELRKNHRSLLFLVEPDQEVELAAYRTWAARRQIDAVILLDLTAGDPRIALMDELALPYVLAGQPDVSQERPYTFADDWVDMETILRHLSEQGVRRVSHISSTAHLLFGQRRHQAFVELLPRYGLTNIGAVTTPLLDERAVAKASVRLASRARAPQAIIYDSDILAVWGQHALVEHGVRVGTDIGIVAFDDSSLCRYVTPSITAVDRHPRELGRLTAMLLTQPDGPQVRRVPDGLLNVRQSTALLSR
jgi:DNA-binding LacI/PurR family transcriptional regulator